MQRRTYYFSGHVQGVGFRYTASHVASGYAVKGFVRNLADGRVEMVAEGEPKDLDGLAAELKRTLESPASLAVSGVGPSQPLGPETDPESRARNRRVEIVHIR